MKIKTKILKALASSPATASELGVILFPEMSPRASLRRCSSYCCLLRTKGLLTVIGHVPRQGKKGSRIMSNLYALKTGRSGSAGGAVGG